MLKQLFCKHNYKAIENFHGDAIILLSFKRTVLECTKCNKLKLVEDFIDINKHK